MLLQHVLSPDGYLLLKVDGCSPSSDLSLKLTAADSDNAMGLFAEPEGVYTFFSGKYSVKFFFKAYSMSSPLSIISAVLVHRISLVRDFVALADRGLLSMNIDVTKF